MGEAGASPAADARTPGENSTTRDNPPYRAWICLIGWNHALMAAHPKAAARHEAEVGGSPLPLPRWTTPRGQTEVHDPRTNSGFSEPRLWRVA